MTERCAALPRVVCTARRDRLRRVWCAAGTVCATALWFFAPATAHADESAATRRAAAAREMDRPYTMAQLSLGFLALPAADVCITSLTDCEKGEFSPSISLQNLYRFGRFGVGAGILWATTLRNDAARGAQEFEREHSRRYFLVEALFRYYTLRSASWEAWVGVTAGGVVVNDSWSVPADRDPYGGWDRVGPRGASIGTEGLTPGISLGGEWSFAKNWTVGTQARYSMWFLPEPEQSPTGDFASLSGRVDMFDFGVLVAYRIAL